MTLNFHHNPSAAVQRVLDKLPDAVASGSGWKARCPAHCDQNPSLSITEGDKQPVVVKCHTGCSQTAVIDALVALGVKREDLSRPRKTSTIATYYSYTNEQGDTLYQVVRKPGRKFYQRRPDGLGGWIQGLGDVRRVPYKLHQLANVTTVYVAEGEKDVDRLWSLNIPATTNQGGVGMGWTADYSTTLKAAGITRAYVLPDNDDAGRKHAEKVVASCSEAGIKARIVTLPNMPVKGDVSDWFDAGGTPEQLAALAEAAPVWPVTAAIVDAIAPALPLGELLDSLRTFICRFVVLRPAEATLVALWVAQTHVIDAFEFTAYLHITSPLPECGKTRTLEVIEALVPKPWLTGRVTAAVLMRKVDAEQPVLLLDESDAAFSGPEDYAEALRGLLNSGFARTGVASACVGQGAKLTWKDFKTFCPKAIAGIGRLPSTVESRSIPIALKRRTKQEIAEKWRRRTGWAEAAPIRSAMADWAGQHAATLRDLPLPLMPEGLSDRAEDVLEPLFILADAAGGPWSKDARDAAVALMGQEARNDQATDQSIGLELLADVKRVFIAKNNPEKMRSEDLLAGLCGLDDSPWATFTKGDKLTPHKLARLLRGFDVEPPRKMRKSGPRSPSGATTSMRSTTPSLGICPPKWNKWNNPMNTGVKP